MNMDSLYPFLIFLSIFISIGIGIFLWSVHSPTRRYPHSLEVMSWVGLVLAMGLGWQGFSGSMNPQQLIRPWVLLGEESTRLAVGIKLEPILFLMVSIWLFFLAGHWIWIRLSSSVQVQEGVEKVQGDSHATGMFSLSLSGLLLSAFAASTWMALLGLSLSLISSVLMLKGRMASATSAQASQNLLLGRLVAFAIALTGAVILQAEGVDLYGTSKSDLSTGGTLGVCLFVLGVWAQLPTFPFSFWITQLDLDGHRHDSFSIVGLPGLSSALISIAVSQGVQGLSGMDYLGYGFGLLSTLGAFAAYPVQKKKGFAVAYSLGLQAGCLLAWLGAPAAALYLIFGIFIGMQSIDWLESLRARDAAVAGSTSSSPDLFWIKGFYFLATAIATAAFGTVGVIGVHAAAMMHHQTAGYVIWAILWLLYSTMMWSHAFNVGKGKFESQLSGARIFLLGFIAFFGLGVLHTGLMSGGAFPGQMDQLFPHAIFKSTPLERKWFSDGQGSGDWFALGAGVYWSLFCLGLLFGYLLRNKPGSQAIWMNKILSTHFGVIPVAKAVMGGVIWAGRNLEMKLVRSTADRSWRSLSERATLLGRKIDQSDLRVYDLFIKGFSRAWIIPASVLQLIQSGSVQWYLVFGIMIWIALIIHFFSLK
jgi:hypothetical protein